MRREGERLLVHALTGEATVGRLSVLDPLPSFGGAGPWRGVRLFGTGLFGADAFSEGDGADAFFFVEIAGEVGGFCIAEFFGDL